MYKFFTQVFQVKAFFKLVVPVSLVCWDGSLLDASPACGSYCCVSFMFSGFPPRNKRQLWFYRLDPKMKEHSPHDLSTGKAIIWWPGKPRRTGWRWRQRRPAAQEPGMSTQAIHSSKAPRPAARLGRKIKLDIKHLMLKLVFQLISTCTTAIIFALLDIWI